MGYCRTPVSARVDKRGPDFTRYEQRADKTDLEMAPWDWCIGSSPPTEPAVRGRWY